MRSPFWLNTDYPEYFPDVSLALRDPDGLLAIGGDLSPARLVAAYSQGIFPWYSDGQPILWWSPDPRTVLRPEALRISRSLRKTLRRGQFRISLDTRFAEVLDACAAPRADGAGTWITAEMKAAYLRLHELGIAHSVECWEAERLVGGLYGLALGRVFFGESMFARVSDASKVAFVHLVRQLQRWDFTLIDCQVDSDHLRSLGAAPIDRAAFTARLAASCPRTLAEVHDAGPWRLEAELVAQIQARGDADSDLPGGAEGSRGTAR